MIADSGRVRGRSIAVLFLSVIVALGAMLSLTLQAGAQEATPALASEEPEGLGFDIPEITITAQEGIYSPSYPAPLQEGWYAVTLVNESDSIATASLVSLPEDISPGDLSATLSESFQGEGGELPDWWGDASFAGGVWADEGASNQAAVYLTPGQWTIFSANPASDQGPSSISVLTAEDYAAAAGIELEATPVGATPVGATPVVESLESDNQITITDSGIELASDLTSGDRQVWQVTNDGEQAHNLVFVEVDGEVDETAAAEIAASVAAGELPEDATLETGLGVLGAGQTAYIGGSIQPGTYVVFSTLPDAEGGLQADSGLVVVLTVE